MIDRQERWYRSGVRFEIATKLEVPDIAHRIRESVIDEAIEAAVAKGVAIERGRPRADAVAQLAVDKLNEELPGTPPEWAGETLCGGR